MLIHEPTVLFDLSVLREDTVLDTKQEAFVRATISSTQDFIAGIDVKIRQLENELAELQKQREDALETIIIPAALLAPVRRLPPEVLGEIFQQCVPHEPTHVTPFDSRDAPLLLTRVCHRWRRVAQGTPPLWTKLVLYGRTPEAFFAPMWLENSGSLPLEISVEEYACLHPHSGGRYKEIGEQIGSEYTGHGWMIDRCMVWLWPLDISNRTSQIVAEQLSRIRRLSLVCKGDELAGYFPREASKTLPSLQELYVDSSYTRNVEIIFHNITTPQLHTLVLTSGAVFLLSALECTSNLRILEIGGNCSLQVIVDFVSRCPALQRIDLSGIHVEDQPESMDMSQIVLPELSYLRLGVRNVTRGQSVNGLAVDGEEWSRHTKPWSRLRTPNLQWAEMRFLSSWSCFLSNCMADSQSRLRTLALLSVDLDASAFNNATSTLSAVEKLQFLNCESRAGFWESLIPAEDTPSHIWPLPKLKILSFDAGRMAPEHEAEFVRFVERRAPPMHSQGPPALEETCYLREIKLKWCTFTMETCSALERLREDRYGFAIRMEGESFVKMRVRVAG